MKARLILVFLFVLWPVILFAQPQSQSQPEPDKETQPFTIELESMPSIDKDSIHIPLLLKFAPDTQKLLFGNIKMSLSINKSPGVSFVAHRSIYSSESKTFVLGVTPQINLLSGGGGNNDYKIAILASYAQDLNNLAINGVMNRGPGANYSLSSNYRRVLANTGPGNELSFFTEAAYDDKTEEGQYKNVFSLGQKINWHPESRFEFETSLSKNNINTPNKDLRLLVSFTVNLGNKK